MSDDFLGWDAWKEENKKGFDCTVSFQGDGNKNCYNYRKSRHQPECHQDNS